MASRTVSGLGLVCIVVMLLGQAAAQDFDFYYYVVQWPGSYCNLRRACCYPLSGRPAENFSIHGLWPNYKDGGYPSDCGFGGRFDLSLIQDLVPQMDGVWGSLSCPSSDSTSFWAHEWDKHGTCTGLTERNYFSAALALQSSIDFLSPLLAAGITPGGGPYKVTEIQNLLATALNGNLPGVECNNDSSGRSQLYQVYVCVDTDGATLISCPIYPNPKCKSSVYFPAFSSAFASPAAELSAPVMDDH